MFAIGAGERRAQFAVLALLGVGEEKGQGFPGLEVPSLQPAGHGWERYKD